MTPKSKVRRLRNISQRIALLTEEAKMLRKDLEPYVSIEPIRITIKGIAVEATIGERDMPVVKDIRGAVAAGYGTIEHQTYVTVREVSAKQLRIELLATKRI